MSEQRPDWYSRKSTWSGTRKGLAKVKKLPPKLALDNAKLNVDLDTVKAVIANRFLVMSNYYKIVIRPILKQEAGNSVDNKEAKKLFARAGSLLRREHSLLTAAAKIRLSQLLEAREQLRIVYDFKQSLQNVWMKTATSQKELIEALQQWCRQAEESGLEVLRQFAQQIKGYVPVYQTA